MKLPPALALRFRCESQAWAHFQARPPGYRRLCTHWVMTAKREETRICRLGILIACSAMGRRIPALER